MLWSACPARPACLTCLEALHVPCTGPILAAVHRIPHGVCDDRSIGQSLDPPLFSVPRTSSGWWRLESGVRFPRELCARFRLWSILESSTTIRSWRRLRPRFSSACTTPMRLSYRFSPLQSAQPKPATPLQVPPTFLNELSTISLESCSAATARRSACQRAAGRSPQARPNSLHARQRGVFSVHGSDARARPCSPT